MASLAEFQAQINAFKAVVRAQYASEVKAIATAGMTRIVQRNPYRSGTSKASWRTGVGGPDLSTQPDGFMAGPGPAEAISIATLSRLSALDANPYQNVFITNDLDYVEGLEFGGSQQAPAGMLRITATELESGLR